MKLLLHRRKFYRRNNVAINLERLKDLNICNRNEVINEVISSLLPYLLPEVIFVGVSGVCVWNLKYISSKSNAVYEKKKLGDI